MVLDISTNWTAPFGRSSSLFKRHPPMKMPIQAPGIAMDPVIEKIVCMDWNTGKELISTSQITLKVPMKQNNVIIGSVYHRVLPIITYLMLISILLSGMSVMLSDQAGNIAPSCTEVTVISTLFWYRFLLTLFYGFTSEYTKERYFSGIGRIP